MRRSFPLKFFPRATLRLALAAGVCLAAPVWAETIFPRVEASFTVPALTLDFFAAELTAEITSFGAPPLRVPAFFDGVSAAGEPTWKVRYTPTARGRYEMKVFTGDPAKRQLVETKKFQNARFEVAGEPLPGGFVRLDPRRPRAFSLGGSAPFYPIGHNIGWGTPEQMEGFFGALHTAGANWSRIWMTHFDGSNLDWSNRGSALPRGELDLNAARWWDRVLAAAEQQGIRFQMVLQHHGQYSTTTNANWQSHPWNAANGGFLQKPEDFFTDAEAIRLTRLKYRYIVARYGFSPAIMAWELFNEVQFTDGHRHAPPDIVSPWHAQMAAYLRSIDPWHHLVTSSSLPPNDPSWATLDYYQFHGYPDDVIADASGYPVPFQPDAKPWFFGELGRADQQNATDDGRILRSVLWPSMMSTSSGSAQYWYWESLRQPALARLFAAATGFLRLTKATEQNWPPLPASVWTDERIDLEMRPRGWAVRGADPAPFDLPADGRPIRFADVVPNALYAPPERGRQQRPGTVSFRVHCTTATQAIIGISQVAGEGSKLEAQVDGRTRAELAWPATPDRRRNDAASELRVALPAGDSVLTLKNTGGNWFNFSSLRIERYLPQLVTVARGSAEEAIAWIANRAAHPQLPAGPRLAPLPDAPIAGALTIPSLRRGRYRVRWWDTVNGKVLSEATVASVVDGLTVPTPPIQSDLACWIQKSLP